MIQNMAYPGVYPDENDIIPYSPRRKFGFTSSDKTMKLESMKDMSIDQIIGLYRDGYILEDISPTNTQIIDVSTIKTAQGITISTGALILIIGTVGLIWYLRGKGKI